MDEESQFAVLCEQNELLAEFAYQYQPMTDAQLKMFNNQYKLVFAFFIYYSSIIINKLWRVWLCLGVSKWL